MSKQIFVKLEAEKRREEWLAAKALKKIKAQGRREALLQMKSIWETKHIFKP
eukprot:CAMPEP_0196594562 /NCGR_PEP_ID=MMETSP1081-20130531/78690_1 /TAXON_ID=36882 /ORGANISM="Pyramimonas amylifera, Strain CCMP720" /LENGTH=51 /DNA_ID=CAMNT_0041918859 /DNA_START=565 /DNA_END=720 /DNA_ORIENTATION=+